MGCTICKVSFIAVFGIAGVVAGAYLGGPIAAFLGIEASTATIANWSEVIGLLIGLGIGVTEMAEYVCCHWANCKEYCPKGSTEFWTAYAASVQRTHGHLSAADCKALQRVINELKLHGQVDDTRADALRTALAKRCPN